MLLNAWQIIHEGFNLYSFSSPNFIRRLIISLIIFPIDGYIQSVLLWRKYDKKYILVVIPMIKHLCFCNFIKE
jgi:hypothetical protein